MQREAKGFAGCKVIGAPAPNQCQIITFLTLKTDNRAKLKNRIEKYTVKNTFKQNKTYIY